MKHIFSIFILVFSYVAQAQNVGINNTNPQAALDLNGDLRLRSETLTAVMAGLNVDVDISTLKSSIYMFNTALNGVQISGFNAGGVDGRMITVFNNTAGAVQLYDESNPTNGSMDQNKILTGTGNTAIIYGNGSATLRYDVGIMRWTIVSSNYTDGLNATPPGSGPWNVSGADISNSNSGNVGIGTVTPMYKLDVQTNASSAITLIGTANGQYGYGVYGRSTNSGVGVLGEAFNGTAVGGYFLADGAGNEKALKAETFNGGIAGFFSSPTGKAIITDQGNVGIGEPNPVEKLHVNNGNAKIGANAVWSSAANDRVLKFGDGDFVTIGEVGGDDLMSIKGNQVTITTRPAGGFPLFNPAGNLLIPNGNVGIGTTTPSHKLSVNGIIRSKEILVESAPWPDYVFSDEYKLNDLSDVEKYINENNHLPNFPNAKDIETNGQSVGEIQRKMMEKIEELTLYIIELNKRIGELENKKK